MSPAGGYVDLGSATPQDDWTSFKARRGREQHAQEGRAARFLRRGHLGGERRGWPELAAWRARRGRHRDVALLGSTPFGYSQLGIHTV